MSIQFIRTVTGSGFRYYVDGRRVSRDDYELQEIMCHGNFECLQTVRIGGGWRHYKCGRR